MGFLGETRGLIHHLKAAMLPSNLLMLMGTVDCVTTVIGIHYFDAVELNPIMAGIIHNIPLFLALKLTATLCISITCMLAAKTINSIPDKSSRSFQYGNIGVKVASTGLVIFMFVVVANNLIVLLA